MGAHGRLFTSRSTGGRVEAKVCAATLSAGLVTALIVGVEEVLLGLDVSVGWQVMLVQVMLAALATFAGSYAAPHTSRPDLSAQRSRARRDAGLDE